MIVLSPQDALLLTVLLLCVPLQLWLSNNLSSDARDGQLFGIIRSIHKSVQQYMSPHYWSTLSLYSFPGLVTADKDILEYSRLSYEQEQQDQGECPAVEVLRLHNAEGHFASSTAQRRYRTPLVHYRVGQVVLHRKDRVKGVIVGWDDTCMAPQDFLERAYEAQVMTEVCQNANYLVLVHMPDSSFSVTQYVAQRDLETVANTKVAHPKLDVYFSQFDGSRYLLRGWLAAIYPED